MKKISEFRSVEYIFDNEEERKRAINLLQLEGWEDSGQIRKVEQFGENQLYARLTKYIVKE